MSESSDSFNLVIKVDRKTLIKSLMGAKKEVGSAADEMMDNAKAIADAVTGGPTEAFKEMGDEAKKTGQKSKKSGKDVQAGGQRMQIGLDGVLEAFDKLGNLAGGAFSSIVAASPAASVAMAQMQFQMTLVSKELGDALAPILQRVADLVAFLADKFMALPGPVKTAIGVMILLFAAGTKVAGIITALSVLSGPMILAILAIAAAALLLYLAWDSNFAGIQDVTAEVFGIIGPLFKDFADKVIGKFKEMLDKVGPDLEELGVAIGELAIAFAQLWSDLEPIINFIINLFFNELDFAITMAIASIMLLVSNIKDAFKLISALIKGDWQGAWDAAMSIFGNYIEYFETVFGAYKDKLMGQIDAVLTLFEDLGFDVGGAFEKVLTTVTDAVDDTVGFFTGIGTTISDALNTVISFFTTFGTSITDIFQKVIDFVDDVFITAISGLWDEVKKLFSGGSVGSFVEGVAGIFAGMVTAVLGPVINAMNDVIENITSVFMSIKDTKIKIGTGRLKWEGKPFSGLIPDMSGWRIPMPSFHSGGVFRAPVPGGEGIARLQDRETILTRPQSSVIGKLLNVTLGSGRASGISPMAAQLAAGGNNSSSGHTIVTINNPSFRDQNALEQFAKLLRKKDYEELSRTTFTSRS